MQHLFNYNSFPKYVFNKANLNYVFIAFNLAFENEFLFQLKRFLEKHKISTISIENVKPKELPFIKQVLVTELPTSFTECVSAESIKTHENSAISFQMLTEQGLIYTSEAKELFCIVLERNYWIAIIGLSNSDDLHFFTAFAEENIIEHLSSNFNDRQSAEQFINEAKTNWK